MGNHRMPLLPDAERCASVCTPGQGCDDLRNLISVLDARNDALRRSYDELRLVLDHVGEGLLTLRRDGTMLLERSAVVERWLGPAPAGAPFWEYLGQADPAVGAMFQVGWTQVVADLLPLELVLDQLPQNLRASGRVFSLRYQPIRDAAGGLDRVLVVIGDITSEIEKARLAAEGRMLIGLCERILHSRSLFLEFLEEANELVRLITAQVPGPDLARNLHTLKGICRMHGVTTVATLCHEIEERLREGPLLPEDRDALVEGWRRLSNWLLPLFGRIDTRRVEIDDTEYAALLDGLSSGQPRSQLLRLVRSFRLQPVQARMLSFADQARELSRRLGKAPLKVHVECGGLRHQPERWARFFSAFTHVVRNAVDHGIETQAERLRAGKPGEANLILRAMVHGEYFLIEVADDGRGVQWERLRERARQAGHPTHTREQLLMALFAEGISTRDEVTETSGRGVGLSAVREASLQLGGQIRLASEPGRGTTFQFRFPASALVGSAEDLAQQGAGRGAMTTRAPQRSRAAAAPAT